MSGLLEYWGTEYDPLTERWSQAARDKAALSRRLKAGDHVSFFSDPANVGFGELFRDHGQVLKVHPTEGVTIKHAATGAVATYAHEHPAMKTLKRARQRYHVEKPAYGLPRIARTA